MAQIYNCPFGLEDGHIVGYIARNEWLELRFEFWNEQEGMLVFEGFVGLHDNGAIGATVNSLIELQTSELIASFVRRYYEHPPKIVDWKHFQFLDVDGDAMFDVIAKTCSFSCSSPRDVFNQGR
jgi:hypothetical protein